MWYTNLEDGKVDSEIQLLDFALLFPCKKSVRCSIVNSNASLTLITGDWRKTIFQSARICPRVNLGTRLKGMLRADVSTLFDNVSYTSFANIILFNPFFPK
jgi:hypothetical protein